ncbi:MAG: beta strand repeat-containing protein [Ferruginibacter sp.]
MTLISTPRILTTVLLWLFLFAGTTAIQAQTAASATWALTSNSNVAVTGNITGSAASIGAGINSPTYSSIGISTGSWSNDAASRVLDEYYQYATTVNAGQIFTVTSITGEHSRTTGSWQVGVFYSLDNFATSTQVGNNITINSSTSSAFTFSGLSVVVPTGGTFSIRIYAWESDGNNRSYRNKSIVINGTTSPVKFFRSKATGNWASTSTWETSTNGTSWSNATIAPTTYDSLISILNGHIVTVAASTNVNQVTVNTGGQLKIAASQTLTIDNGAGTDLSVSGTILNQGTITNNGTIVFNVGGNYTHNINGGTIPTASWDATSTCLVNAVTTTLPGGLAQSFGHFTWNCTTQSVAINGLCDNGLSIINGNFTVTSANDQTLNLNNSAALETLTIGGDFSINNALVDLAGSTGTTNITLKGNLSTNSAGYLTSSTASSTTSNGTVIFNNNTEHTLSFSNAAFVDYTNFTVSSNNKLTLLSNINLGSSSAEPWRSNFIVNASATVDLGNYTVTGVYAGNNALFTINSGATLITSNATGISGAIATTTLVASFSSAANYVFKGASTGTFTTTPTANTVNGLSINNPGNTVQMEQAFNVTSLLEITSTTTLNAKTFAISGENTTYEGSGTILTQNTSAVPFPSGKTWNYAITLNGSTAQIIPAGTYNAQLTLNNASGATAAGRIITVGNFELTNGTFNLSNQQLDLHSTLGGTGLINAVNGVLEMSASSTQTLPTDRFVNNAINCLYINKSDVSKVVTLVGNLNVDSLFQPTKGTFDLGNGDLTLVSNATRTARVGVIVPTDISIVYSGTGRFVHQRYIPAPSRRAWRLLTSPLYESNSVFDSWQNGGVYEAGKGTHITSPGATGAAGNGIDISATNATSFRMWNASTQAYANLTNTKTSNISRGTGTSAANTGYYVFVRGDRQTGMTDFGSTLSNATTLSSKGKLQYGDQTFTDISLVAGGFTLLGNPYAAPVNWNDVLTNSGTTTSRIQRKIYTWDSRLNGVGGYVTLDDALEQGNFQRTPAGSSQTSILQSGQAFFVITKTTAATPITIQFKESNKATAVYSSVLRETGLATTTGKIQADLYLPDATTGKSVLGDGTIAWFRDDFCNCVDETDNIKLSNVNETFGLVRSGKFLATEFRSHPIANTPDTVFLRLNKTTERNYIIKFALTNIDPTLGARLVDRFTNSSTALSYTDTTTFSFDITADAASKNQDRFIIVFGYAGGPLPVTFTQVKASARNNDIQVEWQVDNQINIASYDVEKSTDGRTFTQLNNTIATGVNGGTAAYQWLDTHAQNGDNFYRIKSLGINGTFQYSKVVKVSKGNVKAGIAVFPNPITDGTIGLQMNNLTKGTYTVVVTNAIGQRLISKTIQHDGGSVTETIQPSSNLAKGMYQLTLIAPDQTQQVTKVIVQ